jgi:hypothetical protein
MLGRVKGAKLAVNSLIGVETHRTSKRGIGLLAECYRRGRQDE